jgi:hypothetical protein
MSKKEIVDALEYRGGYSLINSKALEALIEGYREGIVNKDSLRVFAAHGEASALHAKSKVDLSRIINSKATLEGVKRLRRGAIDKARITTGQLSNPAGQGAGRRKCVSRKALRAIAQGRLTCTESIVLLMYFMRRITQVKSMKRLEVGERYARFTYGELSELSGIPKANISRAVASLKQKGFISTVWVVKPNENEFGLLFVDGPSLTLIKSIQGDRSKAPVHKTTTPPERNNNTPVIKITTLRKDNPKREIQRERAQGSSYKFDSELSRIIERARQMKENFEGQAA